MKRLILNIVFVLSCLYSVSGQTDLSGKYWSKTCGVSHGYFLRLLPDSTAHYTPIYESADDYETGKWQQSNDTVIVTLTNSGKAEYFKISDSLILEKINPAPHVLVKRLFRQEAYYSNGDIKYKINVIIDENGNNQFQGRLCFYYPNKRLRQVVDYKNGKKHGIEINFKQYGYFESYGAWREGEKHGDWITYDADFNPKTHRKYKAGKLKHENNISRCFPGWDMEIFKKLYSDD